MSVLFDPEFVASVPSVGQMTVTTGILGITRHNNKFVKGELRHRGHHLESIIFAPDAESWFDYLAIGDLIAVRSICKNNREEYPDELRAVAIGLSAQPIQLITAISARRDTGYLYESAPSPDIVDQYRDLVASSSVTADVSTHRRRRYALTLTDEQIDKLQKFTQPGERLQEAMRRAIDDWMPSSASILKRA